MSVQELEPIVGAVDRSEVRKRRHPWWWVGTAALLVAIAMFANMLVTNQNLEWDVVLKYLFDRSILRGVLMTIILTVVAMAIALILATVIAAMRLSGNPLFRAVSGAYIWFFRGVPALVQIVFWYSMALLVPKVSLGIPFGPSFWERDTNSLITPYTAGILALSLCESAYLAEIIRAGIVAVGRGQTEAARSLGIPGFRIFRRIIFPQALKIVVPPIGNQFIGMLKFTSLVSVIALPELLYSAQIIYSITYQTIPLLIVATIWYLVLATVLTWTIGRVEYYFARDTR